MKRVSYVHLPVFAVVMFMLCGIILTSSYAQETPTAPYEVQQNPSGEVEIIVPARIKNADKEQDLDESKAYADAKRDVKAHINPTLWFTTGCFFPLVGPLYSQRDIKKVPAARTLGKSPEYVAFYIDAYKIEMKKLRYNWALGGCIVGGLVDVCIIGIIIDRNRN